MPTSWDMPHKAKLRAAVLERDGGACWLCGLVIPDTETPTLDHVRPRSMGGSDDLANLRLAHKSCNSSRQNSIVEVVGSLGWLPDTRA